MEHAAIRAAAGCAARHSTDSSGRFATWFSGRFSTLGTLLIAGLVSVTLVLIAPVTLDSGSAFAQGRSGKKDRKGKKGQKDRKDKKSDAEKDLASDPEAELDDEDEDEDEDEQPAGDAKGGAEAVESTTDSGDSQSSGGGLDVDALRQDYLRLRDELFQSRARAASVAGAMYSTKLRIDLNYTSGRFHAVTRATIRVDGASVYDDSSGAVAKDRAPRFEGFVAPGRHKVTVELETTAKDDDRFTSMISNTFTIQVPAKRDITVQITAKDDGNIAFDWKKKQRGAYQPRLDIAVVTTARQGRGPDSKEATPPKAAPPAPKKDAAKKSATKKDAKARTSSPRSSEASRPGATLLPSMLRNHPAPGRVTALTRNHG